jgi:hypothetical protein
MLFTSCLRALRSLPERNRASSIQRFRPCLETLETMLPGSTPSAPELGSTLTR